MSELRSLERQGALQAPGAEVVGNGGGVSVAPKEQLADNQPSTPINKVPKKPLDRPSKVKEFVGKVPVEIASPERLEGDPNSTSTTAQVADNLRSALE